MQQFTTQLTIETPGQGLHEFTMGVERWLGDTGVGQGLLTLFVRHTSCSLLIQENAAPSARRDLERYFSELAPEASHYEHDDEGPDDMPAHLRAALTQTHFSIPVMDGGLALGTWQGIYLFEHRTAPHRRTVACHVMGE